nr:unnamed protein product [Callosobruchus analis]
MFRKEIVGSRQIYRRFAFEREQILLEVTKSTEATTIAENVLMTAIQIIILNLAMLMMLTPMLNMFLFLKKTDTDSCALNSENIPSCTLNGPLRHWTTKYNVSQSALSSLLKMLHPFHPDLPIDARTLMHTPVTLEKQTLDTGEYCHFELTKN